MKVASFDIFDTTLVRTCGKPENIFYLLSKRAYPCDEALQNALFLWRKGAEQKAMERLEKDNPTLEDIYAEFDSCSFPGLCPEKLMALEIETEMADLVPVESTKRLIGKKRSEGYTVCFISDMYLPGEMLKRKLQEEGCAEEADSVFVSCEWGADKRTGKLYDVVRGRLGEISRWEHYGDNVRSDCRQARKKGIKAVRIDTDYTGAEKQVKKELAYSPLGFGMSVLVGMQRAARLSFPSPSSADKDNAADLVASLYVPYVKFVLDKARAEGLKRLYFLSRDGYVLKEIAEAMHDAYPDIELRYLFVSRYSLFLPSLYGLGKEEIYESKGVSSFWRSRMKVADVLHYLRISPGELGGPFACRVSFDKFRTQAQEDMFFEALQCSEVKARILEKAVSERDLLVRYFRAEGLLDGTPAATVDVGWIGTSRLMINRILEHEGGTPQAGFYFGCAPGCLPPRYGTLYSYCSSNLYATQVVTLMEHYYSASPYASTVGYVEENGRVVPVFKDSRSVQCPEVTEANLSMARQVARYVQGYLYMDFSAAMKVWGSRYLRGFIDMSFPLDYSTFYKLGAFDDVTSENALLKRVSPFRLLCYWFKGKVKRCVFPRQSICHTYGFRPCLPENSLRERWWRWIGKK